MLGVCGSTEPWNDLKKEVELGSHSELDCPLLQLSTAGFSDSASLREVFRTGVETSICGVHTGEVPTTLIPIALAVDDSLFGVGMRERIIFA